MTGPRIAFDETGSSRDGHEARYRLAAGYIEPPDVVLDAACGIGYGVALVHRCRQWVGVDIEACVDPRFRPLGRWLTDDLCTWVPDFAFDVALSFETIEHVTDPGAVVRLLCQARRLVIASVPIVPTAHVNPWHLHDFTIDDLPAMFAAENWVLHQMFLQPSEQSAVYIFTP